MNTITKLLLATLIFCHGSAIGQMTDPQSVNCHSDECQMSKKNLAK